MEAFVDGCDLSALEQAYAGLGSAAYRPDLMLKVILLEVFEERRSPAQWSRDVRENEPLMWIGRGIRPSRTALYDFRDRLGETIQELHGRVVQQAIQEGLLDPREGVQDGTFTRAWASRHRTINLTVLQRRRAELQAAISQDESGSPPTAVPRWMAQTPAGRSQQSQRYQKAEETLKKRLVENARRPKDKRLAENKVTVSTSDPQAPTGRDKEKVFCLLYTSQVIVEPNSLLVLAFDVFAQATDTGTLAPMLDQTAAVIGRQLDSVTADAAYATLLDLQECEQRSVELFAPVQENNFTAKKQAGRTRDGIDRQQFPWLPDEQTYACPQGHRLKYKGKERKHRRGDQSVIEYRYQCSPDHCRGCPLAQRCVRNPAKGRIVKRLENQELLDAHRAKMATPEAQAQSKQRGEVVERTFADAKQHRGLRKLHGHGIHRARAEIGLAILAQTALTIHRLRETRAKAGENSS